MGTPAVRRPIVRGDRFEVTLREHGLFPLARSEIRTLQINVGKRCNMACHHCHVEAGPKRTEVMPLEVAERCLALLRRSPLVETVDLTGGAPELNPSFRVLVATARGLGREVIDRCNLTVLFEPGMEGLARFLAAQGVHIVASLPCYSAENVERQRGRGAFEKSIEALRVLGGLGYGTTGGRLALDLVYNPVGPSLPPPQEKLAARYREELGSRFGIRFNRLLTLTNMPIKRFADMLARTGQEEIYQGLLVNHFNPATVRSLMCRSLLSVGWNGRLYDCDFNQMLDLPLAAAPRTVWDIEALSGLTGATIATAGHCFGCAAGAGSSCGGSLQ